MMKEEFHLGGRIRSFPEDFVVEEVWDDRICRVNYSPIECFRDKILVGLKKKNEYLHFTLVKKNWETIRALNFIRKKIHVSLRRFGISGMKDKRAYTAQRVSLWSGKWETVSALRLPEILLKEFSYCERRITLGNAVGNQFTITIRDILKSKNEILELISKFKEFVCYQGVPNLFGPQRLGGDNAAIGAAIKSGNLQEGVELILKKVKPFLKNGGIEKIPDVFWYEKRLLNHLNKNPKDYAGALRKIPKRILRLYTHSYQANIFNEKLNRLLNDGEVPNSITIPGFTVIKMPELRTIPIERECFLKPIDFKIVKARDGLVILKFTLGRGKYASTLLSHLGCSE